MSLSSITSALNSLSTVIGVFRNIYTAIKSRIEKRTTRKREIADEIHKKEAELRKALAEGRITDAGMLNQDLRNLYRKYNNPTALSNTVKTSALVCLLFLSGCQTAKRVYNQPVVIGERVQVVKPGDIIEIPAVMKPAKTWYLVDDVGLSQWLGIPVQK